MLTVTNTALHQINTYFADQTATIRIYLGGGSHPPRLMLLLDDNTTDDATFVIGNHTFCINKALLARTHHITIDFDSTGWNIEPAIPLSSSPFSPDSYNRYRSY